MLERMMSYPVFQELDREDATMRGRYGIEREEEFKAELERLGNQVAAMRDKEHRLLEEGTADGERLVTAFGRRDLLALIEEAIDARVEDPHPDYEIALHNTRVGVTELLKLIEE